MDSLLFYACIAGSTILLGAWTAYLVNHHVPDKEFKYEIIHGMMALGAGVILAAITLVFIPKALKELDMMPLAITFVLGAIGFAVLDYSIDKRGGSMATLVAMVMDYLPESIVVGALYVADKQSALLLSIIIAVQNFPEAFCALRELKENGLSLNRIAIILGVIVILGLGCTYIGSNFFAGNPQMTAYLMAFASGGVLYLLVQDIIPVTKLKNTYAPSLGAALGYLIGLIADKLLH